MQVDVLQNESVKSLVSKIYVRKVHKGIIRLLSSNKT